MGSACNVLQRSQNFFGKCFCEAEFPEAPKGEQFESQTCMQRLFDCERSVKVFNSSVENYVEKPAGNSERPAIAIA